MTQHDNVNRHDLPPMWEACSMSSPSGNQVDGLPLVAHTHAESRTPAPDRYMSRRASSGYSKLEEKYQRRVSDPPTWPEHLMDFSGFIFDFLQIGLYVCKFLLE